MWSGTPSDIRLPISGGIFRILPLSVLSRITRFFALALIELGRTNPRTPVSGGLGECDQTDGAVRCRKRDVIRVHCKGVRSPSELLNNFARGHVEDADEAILADVCEARALG